MEFPVRLFTDSRPQFNSKLFKAVCVELDVKAPTPIEHHPQGNGYVERFNHALVSHLCRYVGERQQDWNTFAYLLTYQYNLQVHRSIKLPPFNLWLSR